MFDGFETTSCSVLQVMEHFKVRDMIQHILRNLYNITVKVKINLEQATKAQRGSRGLALLFP
jgi:hypothetical protein